MYATKAGAESGELWRTPYLTPQATPVPMAGSKGRQLTNGRREVEDVAAGEHADRLPLLVGRTWRSRRPAHAPGW